MNLYRLPHFVAETLSAQPSPPRQVPVMSVVRALLGGIDCLTYVAGGLLGVVLSVATFANTPDQIGLGLALGAIGLLAVLLAIFRTWQVSRALRLGDAYVADVTDATAGRVRWYGSPWGDLARGSAARGSYQLPGTGDARPYYMQQRWALDLKPGDQIWVVRVNGRDVLYAPRLDSGLASSRSVLTTKTRAPSRGRRSRG
jgi:hypothetical protein